jgi:hypothetical protein
MDSSATGIRKIKGDSDAYCRRRIFTTERRGHASKPRSWRILIKQAPHKLIYSTWVRPVQNKELIRSEWHIISNQRQGLKFYQQQAHGRDRLAAGTHMLASSDDRGGGGESIKE